jgi:hypothetical protein
VDLEDSRRFGAQSAETNNAGNAKFNFLGSDALRARPNFWAKPRL